jgi:hypothetical protein
MMRNPSRWASSLTLSAALALCAVGCVSKPTMHLNHAEMAGLQMGIPPSVQMNVVVDVYNPNAYDIAVRAMRGQVTMAERYPIAIDFRGPPDGVWMPAGKTTPLTVPIGIPLTTAVQIVGEAIASPTIPFHFVGRADVTGTRTLKIEKDDYAVDEQGTIRRDQIAAILPNTLLAH